MYAECRYVVCRKHANVCCRCSKEVKIAKAKAKKTSTTTTRVCKRIRLAAMATVATASSKIRKCAATDMECALANSAQGRK